MPFATRVLGVAAITFVTATAQGHVSLRQRGLSPMTCACPTGDILTSTSGASVITVTETHDAPSGSPTTVYVTLSDVVSTVTCYISDGSTVPVETVTITETDSAPTGHPSVITATEREGAPTGHPSVITVTETERAPTEHPSIITVTMTQSPPPGNMHHVVTVTATHEGQVTTAPSVSESTNHLSSQTDEDQHISTDIPSGAQTYNSLSSPPSTASPTVPGNYHYCHRSTCYNSGADVVTTLPPMTTETPACSADVSITIETVYNTVTQTVYGLPTGGRGNMTDPSAEPEKNSTATLVPRGVRAHGSHFGKPRNY